MTILYQQQIQAKYYYFYSLRRMSSRREKIQLMKKHLTEMQKDITAINSKGDKTSKWDVINRLIDTSSQQKLKKILNGSKQKLDDSRLDRSNLNNYSKGYATMRHQYCQQSSHNLSHTLKDIINKIDDNYYIPKAKQSDLSLSIQTDRSQFNKTVFVGKRYQYSGYGLKRPETPKSPQIKTFQFKKTDLILNPQKEKETGLKIVKKIERSPDNIFTDNPKSNTNLYYFSKEPVFLQKKGAKHNKTNSSLVFSPSIHQMTLKKSANSQEKHTVTQKKHFQRHIVQNLCSKPFSIA